MPVRITDDDILDRLVQVEGEHYRETVKHWDAQKADVSPTAVRKHWLEERLAGHKAGLTNDELDTHDPWGDGKRSTVIYGEGGWARYAVRPNGEVQFSEHHAKHKVEAAIAAGFSTY